jgi:hypothetical protein
MSAPRTDDRTADAGRYMVTPPISYDECGRRFRLAKCGLVEEWSHAGHRLTDLAGVAAGRYRDLPKNIGSGAGKGVYEGLSWPGGGELDSQAVQA